MCVRKLLFIFVLLLFFCLAFAQDSVPADPREQTLTQLSSTINGKLLNLRDEIRSLQLDLTATTASLAQASQDLRVSESERLEWETKSTMLSTSLASINQKFSDSLQTITVYKTKLEERNRQLMIFGIIGAAIILAKVAAFILYAKRVPIPRWLDILL